MFDTGAASREYEQNKTDPSPQTTIENFAIQRIGKDE